MRLFRFDGPPRHAITEFGSIAAMISGVARGGDLYQMGCLRIEAGGVLGAHPAVTSQLLLVIEGEGWASGGDGVKRPIHRGMAVYWKPGEEHETTSDRGLTALVLESEALQLESGLIEVAPDVE